VFEERAPIFIEFAWGISLSSASRLLAVTILAGALAGSAMAQAPDAGCALPSEPEGIPAAIDAAITGPMDDWIARVEARGHALLEESS
jgi:hypothetical protein